MTFLVPVSALRQSSVARTTLRNTTPRLPSAGPEGRVQPCETPLQDCPAPGRRPRVNPAKHHSKIAQRRPGGARVQPCETPLQDCPAPGRRPRVQPGETPLQDCPAPGRRPRVNPAKYHSEIAQRRAGGARTTRRNTTSKLPSAGPEALSPQSSVLSPASCSLPEALCGRGNFGRSFLSKTGGILVYQNHTTSPITHRR